MSKIIDDIIVVKLSKLVHDRNTNVFHLIDNNLREKIEVAIQDMVDPSIIVEIDVSQGN